MGRTANKTCQVNMHSLAISSYQHNPFAIFFLYLHDFCLRVHIYWIENLHTGVSWWGTLYSFRAPLNSYLFVEDSHPHNFETLGRIEQHEGLIPESINIRVWDTSFVYWIFEHYVYEKICTRISRPNVNSIENPFRYLLWGPSSRWFRTIPSWSVDGVSIKREEIFILYCSILIQWEHVPNLIHLMCTKVEAIRGDDFVKSWSRDTAIAFDVRFNEMLKERNAQFFDRRAFAHLFGDGLHFTTQCFRPKTSKKTAS